ncbi:hypothetical protein GJ633_11895 [Halorubrum sp. CBA1125]|uniref:hypothetical protein n=1 Tax=Halorubrum sp. CBA1125 TaxID=2668072 RepID=UPI0012E821D7|nr:hypothetical protein [Halorubrum sp. CBA1125]MUW15273.1 hypothetical protein [Halorubrum sp. CBA1125]
MQFPDRQQLLATVFAFLMVTSMMAPGVLASAGDADGIEQTGDSDLASQYDVGDNETTDDGSTDDGSTDDGSTDDGSTDDGSTDDVTDDVVPRLTP